MKVSIKLELRGTINFILLKIVYKMSMWKKSAEDYEELGKRPHYGHKQSGKTSLRCPPCPNVLTQKFPVLYFITGLASTEHCKI